MAPRMKIETNGDKAASATGDKPTPAAPKPAVAAPKSAPAAPKPRVSPAAASTPAETKQSASTSAPKPRVTVQTTYEVAESMTPIEPAARATQLPFETQSEPQPVQQQGPRQNPLPTLVDNHAYDQGWDQGTAQEQRYYPQGQGQSYDQHAYDQQQDQARDQAQTRDQAEGQPQDSAAGQTPKRSFSDMCRSISDWVHRRFPGHEHAFWGGVIALVIALLVFIIGLPRMLLICLLVVVGVALGQVVDGDPKIIRAIANLFNDDRDQQ